MGVVRRTHAEQPALITSAPRSSGDEYDKRRKKYAIMMATRALCVLAAAVTYNLSIAVAIGFAIAGVILPWCAVLIANDRPPKRSAVELGYVHVPTERTLPPAEHDRVVDG
jgi:Flp pilus assembly protein TadB